MLWYVLIGVCVVATVMSLLPTVRLHVRLVSSEDQPMDAGSETVEALLFKAVSANLVTMILIAVTVICFAMKP